MGDNVKRGTIWASVPGRDAEQQLIRVVIILGGLNDDVPVAVLVEDAGVENLVFLVLLASPGAFFQKVLVGKCILRVFIQELRVRML
jgi:hypothetical protein